MNKKLETFLYLSLIALTTYSMAVDNEPVVEQQTRVEVGVKKGPSKHSKKATSASHKGTSAKQDEPSTKMKAKCLSSVAYTHAYHPTYYIKSIGCDGGTIATYDETVWSIAESSAYIAARWIENTPIVITPSKWYSKYDYYVTNKLTNESVNAKLSQGPFVKYAIFIQQIDWNNGFVYLSNGTRWRATVDHNFHYWQAGQAILLGENNHWFDKDYILININENNYVSADLLP